MASETKTIGQRIAPVRFIGFVAIFIAAFALLLGPAGWSRLDEAGLSRAMMAAFDIAAATFLIAIIPVLRANDADEIRKHAAENDANRALLLVITTVVTIAILTAVASQVAIKAGDGPPKLLIVGTLALAWFFSNTVYALHYAHIYYAEGSSGGLDFPGENDPDYGDFIYFAFTLGMTFQTSDTEVQTRRLRRIVTAHSVAAFVFNIGVLAFTINVLGSS